MILVHDVVGEVGRSVGKTGQSVCETRVQYSVGELSRRKRIGYTPVK